MNRINTPLGEISVIIDDVEVQYDAIKLKDVPIENMKVDGRYCIKLDYVSDTKNHKISCVINSDSLPKGGYESGEHLECQAFYYGKVKLSIGLCGDFFEDNNYNYFDYNGDYLEKGMSYEITPKTKSQVFKIGISWLNECTDENDHYTWYGADPSYM